MRLLIIDDERLARERLRRMLALEAGIEAVEEAADADAARRLLPGFRPDALLLDIQMPEGSGIDLAASLPEPAPLVVFVTAHDEHALGAFDANAIDYLLKPFGQERLRRALARLRQRLDGRAAPPAAPPRQLLVAERGGTRVVQVADIDWIETADNYVMLHTAHEAPLLRHTLAALLAQLGPGFVRCHRRAAVRLAAIERIVAQDKGDCELVLRSGARLPCSRQYRAAVLAALAAL